MCKCRDRDTAIITDNGESLFLVSHGFAGSVQRIFNRDEIQDIILASDNVVNILIAFLCNRTHHVGYKLLKWWKSGSPNLTAESQF